jgi:hypothetical protein
MTWLVWRQYRAQGVIAGALLAVLAAVMLADGFHVASTWHSMLAACSGHDACLQQQPPLTSQGVVDALDMLGLIVPAVLGILWGAPLVAHDLESRTSNFAWAQSVTRTRWLAVKAGWLLLAAGVCGGVVAALTTWWSGPDNALTASAFQPGQFDIQGIVPVGYAIFAMALGIAAGAVTRRTLPAIAVTLGGFIALRLLITDFIRPHYAAAVTTYYSVTAYNAGPFTPPGRAWLFSEGAVSKTGLFVSRGWGELEPALPAACQKVLSTAVPVSKSAPMNAVFSCMQAHGWRGIATYQPAARYWPFQGTETAIYLLLAAALIAVAFVIVRKSDAQ